MDDQKKTGFRSIKISLLPLLGFCLFLIIPALLITDDDDGCPAVFKDDILQSPDKKMAALLADSICTSSNLSSSAVFLTDVKNLDRQENYVPVFFTTGLYKIRLKWQDNHTLIIVTALEAGIVSHTKQDEVKGVKIIYDRLSEKELAASYN